MYKIKPQFELPESVELPDCMYHQKPVNPTIKVSRSRPASGSGATVNGILEPIKMNNVKSEPKSKCPGSKGQKKASPSQSNANITASKTQLVSPDKINAIEERQRALISRIASLHQMISTIHEQECAALATGRSSSSTLGITPATSESNCDLNSKLNDLQEGDFVDIVINADPCKPPYSILFFHKLLQQVYGTGTVVLRALTHSSASAAFQKSKTANRKYWNVFNNNVDGIDGGKKRIIFTVIWKKLNQETELILSPSTPAMIYGEQNITKFLSRILPQAKFPKLNYDGLASETLVRVDSFLESTHLQSLDSLESHLHVLNAAGGKEKLGTVSEFLAGGKEPTVADFFMYSHTAHALLADEMVLSKYTNIMKWLWTCQQYGDFTVFDI